MGRKHVLRRTTVGKLWLSDQAPYPAFHEGEFLISFAGSENFRDSLDDSLIIERTVTYGFSLQSLQLTPPVGLTKILLSKSDRAYNPSPYD
jgi:hypothetical protein